MKLSFTDIDAVLFDFDGVVVQSEHLYDDATQELARQLSIDVPAEFCDRMRGQSDRVFFEALNEEFQPDIDFEELVQIGRKLLLKVFAEGIHYTEGYLAFRQQLQARGIRSALVTSTLRELLDYIFKNSELQLDFEQIITGSDVQKVKPHAEPFTRMCQLLGVDSRRALVIEDSPAGVTSGLAADCFVAALTTTSIPDTLSSAHFVVDSFAQLSELLA